MEEQDKPIDFNAMPDYTRQISLGCALEYMKNSDRHYMSGTEILEYAKLFEKYLTHKDE